MDLRLYDTLTKEKRPFRPIDPANVRMYVCGPTVYDFAHIGNARPVIVFDVLFRLLRHVYGDDHVTYVRNITDVDDKINARAARDFPGLPLNDAIRKVTEQTEKQFQSDVKALGCLPPTVQPRATEFVLPRSDGKTDMVTLIKQLIARGHAYEAGGEVLFDTQSMPDYGALSGRRLDEQQAGARIAVDAHKKHSTDFVLWKQSSDNEPGWDSPWGRGRPGWHIECSAMSAAYLGDLFDIHGGGLDLIFPHHENEIAQSRCAHGTPAMANTWMHNGFLQVEGEKMSKSLGNFVTIRQLREGWAGYAWPGDALRFAMLGTHYRQPIDWTAKALDEAHKTLWRWYGDIENMQAAPKVPDDVLVPLADDLNSSGAIAGLHALHKVGRFTELCAALNFLGFSGSKESLVRIASATGNADGKSEAKAVGQAGTVTVEAGHLHLKGLEVGLTHQKRVDAALVDNLIAARAAARARKDFKESDRIRDELAAMGVILKDGKNADGKPVTTWEIAR